MELFRDPNCELCKLKKRTPQFYLSIIGANDYTLTICDTCKIPMLVCRFHELEPEGKEQAINKVIEFFRLMKIEVQPRMEMKKIKSHWHCHFRLKS